MTHHALSFDNSRLRPGRPPGTRVSAGFGTLTGETGAGKSILVDALAFALGERADAGLIRAGSERAEVNAEFDLAASPAAADWLQEHDLDTQDGLLLRRVLDANGRSRAYLNGSPVTVQQLREVAESLVDIHGQHAHQSLLRSDAQRALLDSHARLEPCWRKWPPPGAMARSQDLLDAAASRRHEALAAEREQLDWQVRELQALGFSTEEWLALNEEHKRLAHAASLVEGRPVLLQVLRRRATPLVRRRSLPSPIGWMTCPSTIRRCPKSPSCCNRCKRNSAKRSPPCVVTPTVSSLIHSAGRSRTAHRSGSRLRAQVPLRSR
jgi:DNA repair ATPase RecN